MTTSICKLLNNNFIQFKLNIIYNPYLMMKLLTLNTIKEKNNGNVSRIDCVFPRANSLSKLCESNSAVTYLQFSIKMLEERRSSFGAI